MLREPEDDLGAPRGAERLDVSPGSRSPGRKTSRDEPARRSTAPWTVRRRPHPRAVALDDRRGAAHVPEDGHEDVHLLSRPLRTSRSSACQKRSRVLRRHERVDEHDAVRASRRRRSRRPPSTPRGSRSSARARRRSARPPCATSKPNRTAARCVWSSRVDDVERGDRMKALRIALAALARRTRARRSGLRRGRRGRGGRHDHHADRDRPRRTRRSTGSAIKGTVGPGFDISVDQTLRDSPASYELEVEDLSDIHNFHLTGPARSTSPPTSPTRARESFTVELRGRDVHVRLRSARDDDDRNHRGQLIVQPVVREGQRLDRPVRDPPAGELARAQRCRSGTAARPRARCSRRRSARAAAGTRRASGSTASS